MEQAVLLELPERGEAAEQPQATEAVREPRFRMVDRSQKTWCVVDVEASIGPDHKARAIWELAGQMDLGRFAEGVKVEKGGAGRSAWDPQLLVSLWVYAYSEGISSAREMERLLEWEPGFRWLAGLEVVNHHTLSDFRVQHKEALEGLFAQLLVVLEGEGLLSLERVMHDGTKIRAQGGADSFRREKTVREQLERARQVVEQMGDPREEGKPSRREAAQRRAARERAERMEEALKELQQLQAEAATEEEAAAVRVSLTEPEARWMKHGDQAIAPSFNTHISTEAQNKLIVGVHLSQCSSDAASLEPALERVQENLGRAPEQAVVDGGFTNRETIVKMEERQIDLIGSLPKPEERSAAAMKAMGIDPAFGPQQFVWDAESNTMRCPAGQVLAYVGRSQKRGNVYRQYRARGTDCAACAFRSRCCPKSPVPDKGRTVSRLEREDPAVARFRQKMESAEAKAIYKQRGEVAEFPNAWIKDKLGLRKFRVRGLLKAGMEAVWACLTYDIMQWIRLRWCPRQAALLMPLAAA